MPAALNEPLRTKGAERLDVVSERARQVKAEDRCRSGTCDVAKMHRLAVGRPGGKCVVRRRRRLFRVCAVGVAHENLQTLIDEVVLPCLMV